MSSKFSHRSTRVMHTPSICKSKVRIQLQLPQCATTDVTAAVECDDPDPSAPHSLHGQFCLSPTIVDGDFELQFFDQDNWQINLKFQRPPATPSPAFSLRMMAPGGNSAIDTVNQIFADPGPGNWTGDLPLTGLATPNTGLVNLRMPTA